MTALAPVAALEFDEIAEGLEVSLFEAVTAAAIDRFVAVSGDTSPLHTNDEFAMSRGFHGRVVHGAYLMALVSRLVGTRLPGVNAVVHQMQLTFHKPTYVGDNVTIVGFLERKIEQPRAILLSVVIEGKGATGESRRVASGRVQVGFTNPR